MKNTQWCGSSNNASSQRYPHPYPWSQWICYMAKGTFRSNSVYELYDREIILDYLGRPNLNTWVLKNREISWLAAERCGRWGRQSLRVSEMYQLVPRCQVRCRSPSGSKTSPDWQPVTILGPQSYNHKQATSAHTLNKLWSRFSPRELPMRNKPCWYLGYSLMELRREKPVNSTQTFDSEITSFIILSCESFYNH